MDYEFYKSVVDNLHDGLYFVNKNREITYWNKGAELISGFTAEEVVGRKCSDNILTHVDKNGNSLCLNLCPLAATIRDRKPREAEIFMHHKNGHRIPLSVRVNPMLDGEGNVTGGFELFTDISNKQANELRVKELERMSYLDHLTQLSNRAFIEKELVSRFDEFKKQGIQFGILFIDIDYFKKLNDTYGHDTGDNVLRFVSDTLAANCRPFDLYGRWGGEEFLGIIRNVDEEELKEHGEKICQLVRNSYTIYRDEKLSATISIGATLIKPNDEVQSLVKRADELLYTSKTNGRDQLTLG